MAEARRQPTTSGAPAGWVILLGLMVLALVVAAVNKGCAEEELSPAAQSPTTSTAPSAGDGGGSAAALDVINKINAQLKQTPVAFVTGKTELAPESKTVLDKTFALLNKNPDVKAEVRGYTDDQGEAAKNLQLSQARAEAVVDYLASKGIPKGRLLATGLGEASPIADNTTEAGRAKNRRIEFALA